MVAYLLQLQPCCRRHKAADAAVSVVGFEPTVSWSRTRRRVEIEQGQTFPHAEILIAPPLKADAERPAGVEPAHLPWQSSRLPLHHGRCFIPPAL